MDINYSIVPVRRPAACGPARTTSRATSQMELARGKLPDGKRLVSRGEPAGAARAAGAGRARTSTYGMGLFVDTQWGIPVVHHGGELFGYNSDMICSARPRRRRGDPHQLRHRRARCAGRSLRRIAEVLFDGKPEAAAQRRRRGVAAQGHAREGARAPGGPGRCRRGRQARGALRSKDLGALDVLRRGEDATIFDFGEWQSAVASRKNDDGTISFITIDPTLEGLEFVVGRARRQARPRMRDAQHEYVFLDVSANRRH